MPPFLLLLLLLLSPGFGSADPVAVASAPSEATRKTFDACVRTLRSTPYFRSRDDVDWQQLEREWRPRADDAEPGDELRDVLNEMLVELDASHAAVLDGAVYRTMWHELHGQPSPTFGVLLEESLPGRLFVRALFEQGPGERAGLRLGDEVALVDGAAALASATVVEAGYDPGDTKERLYTLRARAAGNRCTLATRSAERARLQVHDLVAESMSGIEAGRRSARVVEVGGRRIGVFHLWMVARGAAELLAEVLRGPLAGCDALVVDLRGRGGFADEIPGMLASFRAARRAGQPVVFLIDDRTRSAKEIVAWHVRDDALGTLVGEATEGAVLGAGFFPLPGGLYLEAPMMEVPVGDGSSLEGVGVAPDVAVDRAGPFAAGVDPILVRGLKLAAQQASGRGRRRGPY